MVKKIGIVIIGLVAIAALVLIIINMTKLNNQSENLNSYIDRADERYAEEQKKEDEFIEDGAVIGDIYTIKSTKTISDAYINGQDPSGLNEQDKKTYDAAVKALDEATKGATSDYEKELGIFRWISKNIKHSTGDSTRAVLQDEAYPVDSPYGVLNGKMAVCVGYATTFRLLVNMIGLECHIPHSEGHSWDLVKLDDEEWYLVDLYSATSESDDPDYRYFNMDEKMAAETIASTVVTSLPRANGKKYLYPVQIAQSAKDVYEIPSRLKKALKDDELVFSMRFDKDPTEEEVLMTGSLTESLSSRISTNMPKYANKSLSIGWCRDENEKFIFSMYITDNEMGGTLDPKSSEAKEMRKAMDKVFGKTDGYDPFVPEDEKKADGTGDGKETETYTYNSVG